MAIMISGLYDALKSAGAKEDKARQAAIEVAAYDNELKEIKSDLKLIKWMLTFILAFCVAITMKLFV